MKPSTVSPEIARWVARALFLESYRGQEAWFDLAWELWPGICAQATADPVWQRLLGLGATGLADASDCAMARRFALFAETFLIHSPTACDELSRRLRRHAQKDRQIAQVTEHLVRVAERAMTEERPEYVVWESKANDILPPTCVPCTARKMEEEFWNRRDSFDVVVRGRSVYVRGDSIPKEIDLNEREYRLLVLLLRFKHRPLPTIPLYLRVYDQRSKREDLTELYVTATYLKSLVSRLRLRLRDAVPGFEVPDKRPDGRYVCRGEFTSCLILAVHDEGGFGIPETLS